jgi:hypothetical protein
VTARSVPRLDDPTRLRVQLLNLTAASADLRQHVFRRFPAWRDLAFDARKLRDQAARVTPARVGDSSAWWRTENAVAWAATRIRFRLGDPIPGYAPGTALRFPPGEGPMQHSNIDDVRFVLDYLEEVQR